MKQSRCPWCNVEPLEVTLFIEQESSEQLTKNIPLPDSVELSDDPLLLVRRQRGRERCNNCGEIVKTYSDMTLVKQIEEL